MICLHPALFRKDAIEIHSVKRGGKYAAKRWLSTEIKVDLLTSSYTDVLPMKNAEWCCKKTLTKGCAGINKPFEKMIVTKKLRVEGEKKIKEWLFEHK